MEGRLPPPPPSIDQAEQPPLPSPRARNQHGTYIVQIPKDQVYRFPPPENALIVQRHRNPPRVEKKRGRCCSGFLTAGLVVLSILAVICIMLATLYFIFIPDGPEFSVTNFVVKSPSSSGQKKSRPQYQISLTANNRNKRLGLEYHKDAEVSLLFENKKVGTGKFPSLDQETQGSAQVKVELAASNEEMPRQMDESMNEKKSNIPVSFDLNMKLAVKMTTAGLKTWPFMYEVQCKFKVSSLRINDTGLLSQQCHTN